eukprot:4719589-Pleurochrysis_carterae.AAC.9
MLEIHDTRAELNLALPAVACLYPGLAPKSDKVRSVALITYSASAVSTMCWEAQPVSCVPARARASGFGATCTLHCSLCFASLHTRMMRDYGRRPCRRCLACAGGRRRLARGLHLG